MGSMNVVKVVKAQFENIDTRCPTLSQSWFSRLFQKFMRGTYLDFPDAKSEKYITFPETKTGKSFVLRQTNGRTH